jgi:hypothetical protein
MLKKTLPLLILPLLGGCVAAISNLSPRQQVRNAENVYPVEVALSSRQQTMRWESIKAQVVVGNQAYDLNPTPLMTNRWEGSVPVPPGVKTIHYHYRFDFLKDAFGGPVNSSLASQEYTLRVTE